jgi:hypothetical protein
MHEDIAGARAMVATAVKRLQGSSVARETNEIVREQHRVVGDWDTGVALARQVDDLVRQRLMGK